MDGGGVPRAGPYRPRSMCLVRGTAKFSAPVYRMCRVVAEQKDSHGRVRTVEVEYRGRFASEAGSVN